ncbi:hypothetical protein [Microbacterium aurum]
MAAAAAEREAQLVIAEQERAELDRDLSGEIDAPPRTGRPRG